MAGNGWIPPVPQPASNKLAVCVSIPDDPESRQAFFGAIYLLSQVWSWSPEHDETARQNSAEYWLNELANIGNQLSMRFEDCGDFMSCQDVIDCLSEGDGATFINNVINRGVPYGTTTNLYETYITEAVRNTPLAPPPASCDKDELWAGIRYLVARLDELGRDILEDIIAQTALVKQLNTLVEAIPIVGDVAASAVNFAVEAVPTLLSLYDSYSSEAVLDEIACAIFEITCNDCRYPTFDELLTVYQQWSAIDLLTNPTAQSVLQVIIDAPTYPAETAYRSFQNALIFTLSAAGRVGDIVGLDVIELYCTIGGAVPSNAWEVLCGGCGEQQDIVIPFTQANSSNFVLQCGIQLEYAIYGTGGCEFNPSSYSAIVNWYAPAPITLNAGDYVEVDGLWNANGGRALFVDFWLGGALVQQFQLSPLLGSQIETVNFTGTFDRIKLQYSNGASSNGRLDSLAVRFGTP